MSDTGVSQHNGSADRQSSPVLPSDAASRAVVAAALIAGADAAAQSAATAIQDDGAQASDSLQKAPQTVRSLHPSRPRRRVRAVSTQAPIAAPAQPQPAPETNTNSELRDWIKDNATLLSNASLLISIAALALNALPDTGVLDPYIKALIFGAALLLLVELHHQWPADLQLHMVRSLSPPENHSWRMTAFAFLMQLATLVFAVWATLNSPLILVPLTAIAIVLAFRRWYFRRFQGVLARGFGILALIAVLLLSELLMVVVWAVVADENITIEFWADDRPGLTIEY